MPPSASPPAAAVPTAAVPDAAVPAAAVPRDTSPHPPAPSRRAVQARHATVALVLLLALLGFAWETVLAPLRPGGTLLALKVLPLALALPPLRGGAIRAYQWWSMAILLYVCEGVVRGMSDPQPSALLGWIEFVLATAAYTAIMLYIRWARQPAGMAGVRSGNTP
ncbi:MAG: DUF2069 domain-containing protein [Lautropia sp.]